MTSTSIEQYIARSLTPFCSARRWLVAYSGGLDSHVLLHALVQWRQESAQALPPIRAIHVNHQLQSGSDHWQQHCESVCAALQVPLQVVRVEIESEGRGLEDAARKARYAAFEQLLGEEELLLMAHHADDQIETFLLRLLRGSGMRGLAAVPPKRPLGRGRLLRPLLELPRESLETYAQQQGLQWVEDPSNQNTHYDRNYLRHQLLPVLVQRWPHFREPLLRSARFAAQSERLLRQLAHSDLQQLVADPQQALPVTSLLAMDADRRDNLLRFWLQGLGVREISAVRLAQLVQDVLRAGEDAAPVFELGDRQLRRFRDALYLTSLPTELPAGVHQWQPSEPLSVAGAGVLSARSVGGAGLRADGPLEVRFRSGGERCRPVGRAHSQTLKKLLQEYKLPPWWRDRVPLIYRGGHLVAVADLWICEGQLAAPDELGWQLCWHRPGDLGAEFVLE